MILLDTNVVSEPLKATANTNVLAWIDAQIIETLYLSTISLAERRFGIAVLPEVGVVAQVVGKSMEPAIPDGAYCLFMSPVGGSRHGTYLVQLRDSTDAETGERYTVKRYESEKVTSEDGTWRHLKVTLKPNNPDFKPIVLTCEDEGSVQVIAEMLEVVG